jgi:hypothetical protein
MASVPCRRPADRGLLTLLSAASFRAVSETVLLLADLEELSDFGLIEEFTDAHGVTRFRPRAEPRS